MTMLIKLHLCIFVCNLFFKKEMLGSSSYEIYNLDDKIGDLIEYGDEFDLETLSFEKFYKLPCQKVLEEQYDILDIILRHKNKPLPKIILEKIMGYVNSFSPILISMNDIQHRWKQIEITRSHTNMYNNILTIMEMLIRDQLRHMRDVSGGEKCQLWYVMGLHNGFDYGSVVVFHNEKLRMIHNEKEGVMIQDIVKYPIPTISSWLFPDLIKLMPKLNTIIELPINSIAMSIDANIVFVKPIGKQGYILEKYYGYEKLPEEFFFTIKAPCETITSGGDYWYMKII